MKQPEQGQVWKDAIAGALAGAVSRTAMAPVERVKLILQLRGEELGSNNTASFRRSPWAVARSVYLEQGLASFWRGNLSNVTRVAGTAAINFSAMDTYKRLLTAYSLKPATVSLLAGGLAGFTSTTVLYPVEFVRTRLAMDMGRTSKDRYYKGPMDVVRRIFVVNGIAGMYRGYGIAVTGGVVYRLMYLGGYDAVKDMLSTNGSISWYERIICAQGISLLAGTVVYPFDSVRRKLMMQAGKADSDRLYSSTMECIRYVFRDEGFVGFYRGLAPNLVRSVGGAMLLVGYDYMRSVL